MVDWAAYAGEVLRITRDHMRYTNDGLPNPPTDAPLPLGDRSTRKHIIAREEIRELLLPLGDLGSDAQIAATEAETAKDIAEGFASDIVSQGNVPIYAATAGISALTIPVGINAFRTNGYSVAGDGGGGFFVADPTPGPGGVTDAAARTFKLASDEVSGKTFNNNTALLSEYLQAQLAVRRRVYLPAVHPARGLRMSEFATSDAAFDAQTTELQEAVNALLDSSRFYELDLEGNHYLVEDTIDLDHALVTSAYKLPITVKNGTIAASGSAWAALNQPIFHLRHSTGGQIQRWNFHNLNFRGASSSTGSSSGVFIDGAYIGVRFRECEFINPAMFGIRTRFDVGAGQTGQNLRVEFCDIIAPHPSTMAFADRTLIGLDLWQDNDGKLFGNRIMQCRNGLRGAIGSFLIQGNHIFQGKSGAGPHSGLNPGMILGARPNSSIVNNYIDNGHIELREGVCEELPTVGQGYCVIAGNIFTMANSAAGENFVTFRPLTGGINISHLKVVSNQFRVLGDSNEEMTEPFKVNLISGGYAELAVCNNVDIKDNYFWGPVRPQSTHIRIRRTTTSANTNYAINVAGKTPFNLQANWITSLGISPNQGVTPSLTWYERTGGYNGNVKCVTGYNGNVMVELNCNSTSQFN